MEMLAYPITKDELDSIIVIAVPQAQILLHMNTLNA
jgi:hypothetical protein